MRTIRLLKGIEGESTIQIFLHTHIVSHRSQVSLLVAVDGFGESVVGNVHGDIELDAYATGKYIRKPALLLG